MMKHTKPNIIENGGSYPSKNLQYYDQINKFIKIISRSLKIKMAQSKETLSFITIMFTLLSSVRLSGETLVKQ